ncbi:hypothetical protein B0H14DRAFT_2794962 [Mycena olivaceomarginata]|nr:hypothetical protein B0H14DRAFT_2794962 [Mycena olivaceomarginata]
MAGYAFPTTVSPFPRSFRFLLLRSLFPAAASVLLASWTQNTSASSSEKQTRTLFNDAPSLSSPSLFSFIFTFSSLFSSRSSKMLFSSLPAFSPTPNSSGSAFSPNKFASGSTFAFELEFDFSLLSLRSSGAATAVSPTTSTSSSSSERLSSVSEERVVLRRKRPPTHRTNIPRILSRYLVY